MPQALCSSDSWNEIKYMFIFIAIIIFIRMTARPCICLLSHVILSWSHGEKHAIKERNGMLSSSFCLFWKLNDAVISMPCIFFSFYSLGVLMMRSIRRSSNQCTSEQSQCVTSPPPWPAANPRSCSDTHQAQAFPTPVYPRYSCHAQAPHQLPSIPPHASTQAMRRQL